MTANAARSVGQRRALSFSLRGLMLSFVVVSVPLALTVQRAQRQKNAVRILREAGAVVFYDYQAASVSYADQVNEVYYDYGFAVYGLFFWTNTRILSPKPIS